MAGKSIFDKIWERHVVTGEEGQPQLMYVDQHYIHEVTSPQAFQGLRDTGRQVRRPDLTFGTFDHNVPTVNIYDIRDVISKAQIDKLAENVKDFGIDHAGHGSENRELSIWLVLKLAVPSLESSLSVETAIRRPMELSVPLPLGLGPVRWSMSLRLRPSGRLNRRNSWSSLLESLRRGFMPRTIFGLDCSLWRSLWGWPCGRV